jgi:hypothetical protein
MTRSSLSRCTAAVWVVVMLAGCSDDAVGEDPVPLPKGESLGEMRRQAGEALARYDDAVASAGPSAMASVVPPAWDATSSSAGLSIESVSVTGPGTTLTVSFTGAKGPATEPCGVDYYAEAVESEKAVVVIIISQPHAADEICTLVGFSRSEMVKLAKPLGTRAVLEAREGLPVPVAAF